MIKLTKNLVKIKRARLLASPHKLNRNTRIKYPFVTRRGGSAGVGGDGSWLDVTVSETMEESFKY